VAHLHEVRPPDAAPAARWAVVRVRLDDPWDLARLLDELRAAGAKDAIQALLARDPAGQVSIDHRWDAIELLGALHAAGAAGAVDILAARIVEHASLEHLPSVASLLMALHAAGAGDAVRALVARDLARHAHPEEPEEVAVLLEALHAVGAEDAARTLATWAANNAALAEDRASYRFGREPDGAPSPPWRWAELLPDPAAARAVPHRLKLRIKRFT
jgi:hypothetical protein